MTDSSAEIEVKPSSKKSCLKKLLIVFLISVILMVLTVVSIFNRVVTSTTKKVLADYSQVRVESITFDDVTVNPFANTIVIEGLRVPQVKVRGTEDDVLKKIAVFECDTLTFELEDMMVYRDKNIDPKTMVHRFKKVAAEGVILGAVQGPEVKRVALSVFPGLLMGEIPNANGKGQPTKFNYTCELLTFKGKLVVEPSRAIEHKKIPPLVLEDFVMEAKNVTNLPETKDSVMGRLNFSARVGEKGTIKAQMLAKSFLYFDLQGNGEATMQVNDVPLDKLDLAAYSLYEYLKCEKGMAYLDWEVSVRKGRWVPKHTDLVLDQIKLQMPDANVVDGKVIRAIFFINLKNSYRKPIELRGTVTDFLMGIKDLGHHRVKLK